MVLLMLYQALAQRGIYLQKKVPQEQLVLLVQLVQRALKDRKDRRENPARPQ
jgi:hypothetical protein